MSKLSATLEPFTIGATKNGGGIPLPIEKMLN